MTTFVDASGTVRETLAEADAQLRAQVAVREALLVSADVDMRVGGVVREVLRPFFRRPQAIQWRLNW